MPKSTFCPGLFSNLGCASAKKPDSDKKDVLFGLDAQITIVIVTLKASK
jgi:hypothetical protein